MPHIGTLRAMVYQLSTDRAERTRVETGSRQRRIAARNLSTSGARTEVHHKQDR